MEKQEISNNFFIPMPVVLVGTQVQGKDNFMAVGWCARVNGNPPMIACGIANNHHTPQGIAATETFSVNIPSADLLEKTDYCGIASGANTDKSKIFEVFFPTHHLFIGEIVGVFADQKVIQDGKPNFPAIDPLFLTIPDNRYWTLGKHAGDAWSAGKNPKR
jgi:flavin reductase (DIM6/NTAB) family NADH-FMN oxidoreductase RutF